MLRIAGIKLTRIGLCGFLLAGLGGNGVSLAGEKDKPEAGKREATGHILTTHKVLDYEIINEAGEAVGQIEDLMITEETGQVPFVVVSFGGAFGVGEETFAIPWEGMEHRHDEGVCVLSVKPLHAETSPQDANWVDLEDSDISEKLQRSAGLGAFWEPAPEVEKSREELMQGHSSKVLSAQALMGKEIVFPSGEELGEVEQIMFDPDRGAIARVVIDPEYESEAESVSLPWTVFQSHGEEKPLVANVDREQLKNAPARSEDEAPDNEETWLGDLHEHFNVQPYWEEVKSWTHETFGQTTAVSNNPSHIFVSGMVGAELKDANGETIGEIENVIADKDSGQIDYAIVSVGEPLNSDGRLRVVPFQALEYHPDKDCFSIGTDKNRFFEAPSFEEEDWPDLTDSKWSQRMKDFYDQ